MKKIIYLFLTVSVLIFNACGSDDDTASDDDTDNNDTPIATDDNVSIEEGDTITFTINPTDSEDNVTDLTITINSLPETGTLTFNENSVSINDMYSISEFNSIIFEASEINEDTTTSFEYYVEDSNDASDIGIISINITNYVNPIIGTWFEYSDNGNLSDECNSKSFLTFTENGIVAIENFESNEGIGCESDGMNSLTWSNNENGTYIIDETEFIIDFSDNNETITLTFDSGGDGDEVLVYKK